MSGFDAVALALTLVGAASKTLRFFCSIISEYRKYEDRLAVLYDELCTFEKQADTLSQIVEDQGISYDDNLVEALKKYELTVSQYDRRLNWIYREGKRWECLKITSFVKKLLKDSEIKELRTEIRQHEREMMNTIQILTFEGVRGLQRCVHSLGSVLLDEVRNVRHETRLNHRASLDSMRSIHALEDRMRGLRQNCPPLQAPQYPLNAQSIYRYQQSEYHNKYNLYDSHDRNTIDELEECYYDHQDRYLIPLSPDQSEASSISSNYRKPQTRLHKTPSSSCLDPETPPSFELYSMYGSDRIDQRDTYRKSRKLRRRSLSNSRRSLPTNDGATRSRRPSHSSGEKRSGKCERSSSCPSRCGRVLSYTALFYTAYRLSKAL